MEMLSSGGDALMMGQVPCEFRGDWQTFIFQPAAPDMIRHIYSGQHCFKGVFGMDLLSPGDVALTRGLAGDLPQTKEHLSLKTASGWHHPPLSSTARSKCAKSYQQLPAEK